MDRSPLPSPRRRTRSTGRVAVGLAVVAIVVNALGLTVQARTAPPRAVAPAALSAGSGTVTLAVRDEATDAPIADYQFRIDVNDTGDPGDAVADCYPDTNPDYPAGCDWPGVHTFMGGAGGVANLVTQGDASAFQPAGLTLPAGSYLVSVVADSADHKIGGAHFTVLDGVPTDVLVELVADPLPLSTVRVLTFVDSATNGEFDTTIEDPAPAGFQAHIADVIGEVTTDWFGNPLCAVYDGPAAGDNVIAGTGGVCIDDDQDGIAEPEDSDGIIEIPNLGSNRYGVSVVPPDGQAWVQTSTLEGGLDWDVWLYEGALGNDVGNLLGGEPLPVAQFGFVQPQDFSPPCTSGCGRLLGEAWSVRSYLQPAGGDIDEGPIDRPWIAISDLQLPNDQLIWMGRGNADGTFDLANVPPGTYSLAFWDGPMNLLLGITTATVGAGQTVDLGRTRLTHWFGEVSGTVFFDTNSNGRQDAGERGMAGFPLVLKQRDNAVVDAGSKFATTDANGHYSFSQVYPYGWWNVLEAYSDLVYTTGVTYQTDNGPETTRLGSGVDVSTLTLAGLTSRVDWGVRAYDRGTNGGIVGSVTYAVTRNELDPRLAATEDYETGIPGMQVDLYLPIACGTTVGAPCDSAGHELGPDGEIARGQLLNSAITETFLRPTDCVARDAGGEIYAYPHMSAATGGHECIEAPGMANQVKTGPLDVDPPGESEFTAVNGNYGFGDGCFAPNHLDASDPGAPVCLDPTDTPVEFEALAPRDYLVHVHTGLDAFGRPKFQVLREEDVNVFDGDQFTPAVPPPACAGAMHVVDVAGIAPDGTLTDAQDGPDAVVNPGFAEGRGSPFEGETRPLCDVRLVPVHDAKSIAPSFFFFANVPPPGRLYGIMVEDLALGTNPREFFYGEKAGIPNAPIGIYDFAGRLVTTIHTDAHGYFEVLLPSTRTVNCPLPAGPCPNVYRLFGNDPGQPGHPNTGYLAQYGTFETDWQVWPGQVLLADIALIPTAPVMEFPGTQAHHPPSCTLEPDRPELFAVSTPYLVDNGTFSIDGRNLGPSGPTVTLDGTALPTANGSPTHVDVTIPAGTPVGPHQVALTNPASGLGTINGLTFHVLGTGYAPTVHEVGPGRDFATIQAAVEAAAADANALVVVFPNAAGSFTPLGDYYESLVIHSPIKLQGVGPGGVRSDGTFVAGSIVNGLGSGGSAWEGAITALQAGAGWSGNQEVYQGPVVTVLARDGDFGAGYSAAIDGLTIKNGNLLTEQAVDTGRAVQGGGIYVNGYARHLRITNDVITGNGGMYGGAIRSGTVALGDSHNDDLRIAHNRIVANGGSILAGAIGLFAGTNGYQVEDNDICGNFSAEYGGAISHFGLSSASGPAAAIRRNRIWFNGSYDEGAGVMIAGEPATNPLTLSAGSGPLTIESNLIQGNIADDDGGGIRLLQAGNHLITIDNNIIANNVSTHEGGGIALDDATNVRLVNNTVMKNLTTATGLDSNGEPAAAGLADVATSDLLGAATGKAYSDPLQFNNIFWDNRAGTRVVTPTSWTVTGLSDGDADLWDMGVLGDIGPLHPTNSILNDTSRSTIVADASNLRGPAFDPLVRSEYDLTVIFLPWRQGGTFVYDIIVAADLPPGLLGDYRLGDPAAGSPANDAGAASKAGVDAPATDIEGQVRPSGAGFEIGADEDSAAPFVPLLFASGFESGALTDWSATKNAGQLRLIAGAALDGALGMAATIKGTSQAWVADDTPVNLAAYTARFRFDPNGASTGGGQHPILVGNPSKGKTLFEVQFRRTGKTAFTYQLRTVTLIAGKQVSSSWVSISDAPHQLEVRWTSARRGGLQLLVDGQLAASAAGATNAATLDEVRLGLAGGVPTGSSGVEYFDAFESLDSVP